MKYLLNIAEYSIWSIFSFPKYKISANNLFVKASQLESLKDPHQKPFHFGNHYLCTVSWRWLLQATKLQVKEHNFDSKLRSSTGFNHLKIIFATVNRATLTRYIEIAPWNTILFAPRTRLRNDLLANVNLFASLGWWYMSRREYNCRAINPP